MKKAKIMLTALGLFAVVGGALAFKANMRTGNLFCSTTTSSACPVKAVTTTPAAGVILYCTDVATDPCTIAQRVKITQ